MDQRIKLFIATTNMRTSASKENKNLMHTHHPNHARH
jgi:hypothetical protein